MDIADRCAILPHERINPHFGRVARAIESSESRKIAPLINRPAAALNPPHESIIRRPENMRPRASKVSPLAQVTHRATNGAPSRSRLTGLSILTTKDSNSQALNLAHLWILWTIKHAVTYPRPASTVEPKEASQARRRVVDANPTAPTLPQGRDSQWML